MKESAAPAARCARFQVAALADARLIVRDCCQGCVKTMMNVSCAPSHRCRETDRELTSAGGEGQLWRPWAPTRYQRCSQARRWLCARQAGAMAHLQHNRPPRARSSAARQRACALSFPAAAVWVPRARPAHPLARQDRGSVSVFRCRVRAASGHRSRRLPQFQATHERCRLRHIRCS